MKRLVGMKSRKIYIEGTLQDISKYLLLNYPDVSSARTLPEPMEIKGGK